MPMEGDHGEAAVTYPEKPLNDKELITVKRKKEKAKPPQTLISVL